jgi:hypothetical protein
MTHMTAARTEHVDFGSAQKACCRGNFSATSVTRIPSLMTAKTAS